jgi:hypothetical protein
VDAKGWRKTFLGAGVGVGAGAGAGVDGSEGIEVALAEPMPPVHPAIPRAAERIKPILNIPVPTLIGLAQKRPCPFLIRPHPRENPRKKRLAKRMFLESDQWVFGVDKINISH